MVFGALIRGVAYAPDQEETMFNYTVLGFAFIETFAFMLFGAAGTALFFQYDFNLNGIYSSIGRALNCGFRGYEFESRYLPAALGRTDLKWRTPSKIFDCGEYEQSSS